MEIGVGLIIGMGVSLLVGLLIIGGRKKRSEPMTSKSAESARATDIDTPDPCGNTTSNAAGKPEAEPSANSTARVVPSEQRNAQSEATPIPHLGNTTASIIQPMANQEAQLDAMMTEMRELILQLAEIVGKTGFASEKAEGRIENIKGNLLKITGNAALSEAKATLLTEIDQMAKANTALKQQLNEAQNGIASQKAQIEELQSTIRIDFLTKLPNRIAFDERLTEAIHRYNRLDEPFSLLMVDVDFFKNVNDTYGHASGDRILTGVAMKIREAVRTDDFAARFGGEEFMVILPNAGDKVALGVAERLRDSIEHTRFRLKDRGISITISGGIAQCGKGFSAEAIIERSDKALYKAKAEGRNRILVYDGDNAGAPRDEY